MSRILIVNPIPYTSESPKIKKIKNLDDTMIVSFCSAFEKKDDVTLYLCDEFKPIDEEKYNFDTIYDRAILKKIFLPNKIPFLKGFKKYLKENADYFDLIICSEAFSICTYIACKIAPKKVIVWQEIAQHYNIFGGRISRFYFNKVYSKKFRDILVCPRSTRAKLFISEFSSNVSDVIIEHGVDCSKIKYSNKKENFFIVVSQLIERKNISYIINQFNIFLKKYGYKFSLIICGDGELRESLQSYINNLKLEDFVYLKGNLKHDELFSYLRSAIGLLVATRQDNNMVSIIESITCGTPILTNSVPFNADYVKKLNLGIVKDNWNFTDIANLVENNKFYVDNCIKNRELFDNSYKCEQFRKLAKIKLN